jgi:ABC-type multidrug transport system permease subunit
MNLFRMYWQRVLRKPGSALLWMALPFVFMTIYSLVFGGNDGGPPKVGIAIVDQDSSLVSRMVKTSLAQGPVADMLTLVDARTVAEVEELFKKETASAAIVIPDGFGDRLLRSEPDTLRLWRNPRHSIGPQIAEGVTSGLVLVANELYGQFATPLQSTRALMERSTSPTPDEIAGVSRQFFAASQGASGLSVLRKIDVVVIDENEKESEDFSMAALFFPGLIMFGLLSLSLHVEHRFIVDRVNHVTDRLVTAPIAPWRIAVEQRVFAFSFLYLIGMVSLLVGAVIWRIPMRGVVAANLVVVAMALFIAGWNGSLFAMSRSPRAASAIASTAMVFLSILGGGFFPAEFMPPAFQSIIKWIPTGMANLGLTRALTGREITISLPLLFAISLAFFGMATMFGRRRIR